MQVITNARKQEKMDINIVQMGQHFLYLPLYYAQHRKFFGYIGPEYNVSPIITARPSTDMQAYRMLMRGDAPDNPEIHFAVLDPAQILNPDIMPAGEAPALLGGIVTNAAFWAIDRGSKKLDRVSDLAQFSKIIAFQPGTTSYAIAHRIYTEAGKAPNIESVEPGQELRTLANHSDTIVLTPDILAYDIAKAEGEPYQIDLILGTTPEYNNVLVSGLLSRRTVVEHHRGLAIGLLSAINLAAALVRIADPSVIEFAYGYFRSPRSLDRVRSALALANAAHVFPYSIEVVDAHWLNASRAYYHASLPIGVDRAAAKERQEQRAREVLESCIVPYRPLAREAINSVTRRLLGEEKESEQAQPPTRWRSVLDRARWPVTIIGAVLIGCVGRYLANIETLVAGGCLLLAYLISQLKPLRLKSVPIANCFHWIIWVALAMFIVIGVRNLPELLTWDLDKWIHNTAATLVGLLVADIATILAAVHQYKKETYDA